MTAPAIFKQSDVTRAVKGVLKAAIAEAREFLEGDRDDE